MTGVIPASPAGRVEVEDPVHVAVVGDAERRLAVGDRRRDQVVDPGRAVEHRELGVGVQVGERPVAPAPPRPPSRCPQVLGYLWTNYSDVVPVCRPIAAALRGSGACSGPIRGPGYR